MPDKSLRVVVADTELHRRVIRRPGTWWPDGIRPHNSHSAPMLRMPFRHQVPGRQMTWRCSPAAAPTFCRILSCTVRLRRFLTSAKKIGSIYKILANFTLLYLRIVPFSGSGPFYVFPCSLAFSVVIVTTRCHVCGVSPARRTWRHRHGRLVGLVFFWKPYDAGSVYL